MSKQQTFFRSDPYFLPTLAICFGLLALIFFEPLSFDNAVYQQMAREIYQYHRLPYVATWDQNFPGIIYLHYVAIRLFGVADTSVRILDILLQLGFCAVFYKLCRLWLNEHTAAVATVLYAAFYVSGGQAVYFERDPYAAMSCIVSFYLLVRTYHREMFKRIAFFAASLLAGYAILLKPTAALYVAWLGVFLLFNAKELRLQKRGFRLMTFAFLALLPIAIVLLFYAGIPDGLRAFYLATMRYNLDVYARGHSGFREIMLNLLRSGFLFPFATYGAWLVRRGRAARQFNPMHPALPIWLYFGAIAAGLATVVVQRKFWQYHWMPFSILIVPFAAIAIEAIAERIHRPVARHYALVGCIVLCSFIQMNPKSQASILYDITHRQPLFGDTYDFASTRPDFGVRAERAVLRYLDSLGVKDRQVEICSIESHLRLHFQHEALGAYGLLFQISQQPPLGETHDIPLTSYQRQWQRAYVDTLISAQPRFIVISLASDYSGVDTILHRLPGFDNFFSVNYVHDTAFGSYQIYRHR